VKRVARGKHELRLKLAAKRAGLLLLPLPRCHTENNNNIINNNNNNNNIINIINSKNNIINNNNNNNSINIINSKNNIINNNNNNNNTTSKSKVLFCGSRAVRVAPQAVSACASRPGRREEEEEDDRPSNAPVSPDPKFLRYSAP
jgi:hypothetical protein